MREHTSAPDDQVQPSNFHWANVVSDEPIAIHVGTGRKVTEFLRAVRNAEVLTQFGDYAPLCWAILALMLDCVSGRELQASGRLVAWPSRAFLAKHTNRCIGHIARALERLRTAGIIRAIDAGGGIKTTKWELVEPESPCAPARRVPSAPARRVPARLRAGSERAGAPGPSAQALYDPARRRAGTQRACAPQKLGDLNQTIETGGLKPTPAAASAAPAAPASCAQEPGQDGRRAAAAAELEGLEVNPGKIQKLLALETTTRTIVRAAEKARKSRKGEGGLLVWFVQHPDEIPPKFIRQAERELAKPPAPATATPRQEQPAPLSVEEMNKLRSIAGLGPRYPKPGFVR